MPSFVSPISTRLTGRAFRICDQIAGALFHDRMTADRIARHHDIFRHILFIWLQLRQHTLSRIHDALRMRDPRAHLQQHRRIETLGDLISQLGKFQRFCGIGRLQHRHLRRLGIMAAVLLIL